MIPFHHTRADNDGLRQSPGGVKMLRCRLYLLMFTKFADDSQYNGNATLSSEAKGEHFMKTLILAVVTALLPVAGFAQSPDCSAPQTADGHE